MLSLPGGSMSLLEILSIVILSGGFGGVLGALSRLDTTYANIVIQNISFRVIVAFLGYIVTKILFGIGGGIALILAMEWIGKFNTSNTIPNILSLCGLCVIAGFSGERLITILARRLERELEKTKEDIKEAKQKFEEESMYDRTITMAVDVLATGSPFERKNAIDKILPLRTKWPLDRKLHIFLGRLYRSINKYDEAIKILSDFISKKIKAGAGTNRDTADALYNRACYYLLKAKNLAEEEKKELKKLAYDDLEKSFKYHPPNREEAKNDADFQDILGESRFQELTT